MNWISFPMGVSKARTGSSFVTVGEGGVGRVGVWVGVEVWIMALAVSTAGVVAPRLGVDCVSVGDASIEPAGMVSQPVEKRTMSVTMTARMIPPMIRT